jgi:hypothetical protein
VGGQEVDELYARAVKHFKDDAMIHVFAAQYYNIYRRGGHGTMVYATCPLGTVRWTLSLMLPVFHCCALQRKRPSFDVVFIAFQRLQQLRQVRVLHSHGGNVSSLVAEGKLATPPFA